MSVKLQYSTAEQIINKLSQFWSNLSFFATKALNCNLIISQNLGVKSHY